jgi:hypothetical protein
MFIKGSFREYERKPFVTPVKYSVTVLNSQELRKVHNVAVSIDISSRGLGIITDFPLEQGHVLTFENEIKIDGVISRRAAVVKWTGKTNGKYRVGLEFV